MLHTASFYRPQDWVGLAIRVSRRHPRGLTARWETLPWLYPSLPLLRAYRAAEIDFPAFAVAYRDELDTRYLTSEGFHRWAHRSPTLGDFTLLCFEAPGQPCHRQVAARWLLSLGVGLAAGNLL